MPGSDLAPGVAAAVGDDGAASQATATAAHATMATASTKARRPRRCGFRIPRAQCVPAAARAFPLEASPGKEMPEGGPGSGSVAMSPREGVATAETTVTAC